jgi:hypothetical protein
MEINHKEIRNVMIALLLLNNNQFSTNNDDIEQLALKTIGAISAGKELTSYEEIKLKEFCLSMADLLINL